MKLHQLMGSERHLCDPVWITVSNLDDKSTFKCMYYNDTTLGWLFKISTKYFMPNKKYFRVVHKRKSLFLSSSRKKTLSNLGIKDGDSVEIGGVCHAQDKKNDPIEKAAESKPWQNKKKRNAQRTKRKNCSVYTHVLSDEKSARQHKQEHSRSMNPVLEELSPKLKAIRSRLHGLNIKKTAPKEKCHSIKATSAYQVMPTSLFIDENDVKKTRKTTTTYPILVGEAANLYKTSKLSPQRLSTIDLHGLSKKEALENLNKSLPSWVNAAMRGNNPWVLGVDIICGGGSQILSDTVKEWIRVNPQVANRPKRQH